MKVEKESRNDEMRDDVQSVFSDASNLPVETVADEDYEEAVDLAGEMHRHLQDGDDENDGGDDDDDAD